MLNVTSQATKEHLFHSSSKASEVMGGFKGRLKKFPGFRCLYVDFVRSSSISKHAMRPAVPTNIDKRCINVIYINIDKSFEFDISKYR